MIRRKKIAPEKEQNALAPVEDDPADVERHRQGNQADAQRKGKRDGPAPARDAHEGILL